MSRTSGGRPEVPHLDNIEALSIWKCLLIRKAYNSKFTASNQLEIEDYQGEMPCDARSYRASEQMFQDW